MNTGNETEASDGSRSIDCVVRRAFFIGKESHGNPLDEDYREEIHEIPMTFHGWTNQQHCAAGDGSMIYTRKVAVIEWDNGKVDYCEPHEIKFIV